MSSLSNLNSFNINSTIQYTDLRASGPIFDRVLILGVPQTVAFISNISAPGMLLTPGFEVVDIVNYDTADVTYTLQVRKFGSPLLTGNSFVVPSAPLPSGMTKTQTSDLLEYVGFKSEQDWQIVKQVYWKLPTNYSTYKNWWITATVSWYDDSEDRIKSITWDFYDPVYYKLAFIDAEAGFTAKTSGKFLFRSTTSSIASISANPISFRRTGSLMNATASLIFIEPIILVEYQANISGAFNANINVNFAPASAIILAATPAQMIANVNYTAIFFRVEYVYTDMITNNTRLRHAFDTLTFNNSFGINILGDKARLAESQMTVTPSIVIDVEKFKGIVNENYSVDTTSNITAVKTASGRAVSGSLVSVVAPLIERTRQANANINSLSTTTIAPTKITVGMLSWGIDSLNFLSVYENGWLGQGSKPAEYQSTTPAVVSLGYWDDFAAGPFHSIGIKDGELYSWGENLSGQLGLGDNGSGTNRNVPTRVGTDSNWLKVANIRGSTSLAIKTDGSLWAWGAGGSGQLGIGISGSGAFRNVPTRVGFANNWSMVATGSDHVLAINTSGELWVWGDNNSGELGLGEYKSDGFTIRFRETTPQRLGTDTNWTYVGAGQASSFAIKSTSEMFSWGNNSHNHLGYSNTVSGNTVWTPLSVGTGFTQVVTNFADYNSGGYSLALKGGTLFACGNNFYGQLGFGNTTSVSSFTQVGSFTDWTKISAGIILGTSAGIREGLLYVWGRNNQSSLGLGDSINRSSPTLISPDAFWTDVRLTRFGGIAIGPGLF